MQALERRAAQADRSMRAQAERVAQLEAAHTADAALLEEVAEAEAALRDAAKVFTAAVQRSRRRRCESRFGAAARVCVQHAELHNGELSQRVLTLEDSLSQALEATLCTAMRRHTAAL
jgi:hypothetical protein